MQPRQPRLPRLPVLVVLPLEQPLVCFFHAWPKPRKRQAAGEDAAARQTPMLMLTLMRMRMQTAKETEPLLQQVLRDVDSVGAEATCRRKPLVAATVMTIARM